MRTIFIIGASIGFSVGLAMARLPGIETSFRIVNLCKKGAKFPDLVWPKFSEVEENDILLIFPFGNDLQTGFWYRDFTSERQFHLREYRELEQSVLRGYYAELLARILRYQGKQRLNALALQRFSASNSSNRAVYSIYVYVTTHRAAQ
jgi:hypothetical protein